MVNLLEHTAGFEEIQLNKILNSSGKSLTGLLAPLPVAPKNANDPYSLPAYKAISST